MTRGYWGVNMDGLTDKSHCKAVFVMYVHCLCSHGFGNC